MKFKWILREKVGSILEAIQNQTMQMILDFFCFDYVHSILE